MPSEENETETPDVPSHGYWKSIAELQGTAVFQTAQSEIEAREFPAEAEDAGVDPMSRRNFFNLMGASMALAGVAGAGCKRYQKEDIVPLARRPEDQVPGTTAQYATAFELGGVAQALLATSYEGRPIKLDGNPDHPFAGGGIVPGTKRHGGSTAFAQASILSLYDPDRSQTVLQAGKASTFSAFTAALAEMRPQLATNASRIRILSEATSSPTVRALKATLGVGWHEWEPLSWDNEREGVKAALGRYLRPLAKLDRAQTIVALDCDLFVEHPASLRYSRDFAKSRRPDGGTLGTGQISRLWSIESVYTSTGAVADHRLPLRSEHVLPFVLALEAALSGGTKPPAAFLGEGKVADFLEVLGEELRERGKNAVLVAGRRQPQLVHRLVARINHALGAVGQTVDYLEDPEVERINTHADAIMGLVGEIEKGQVDTLVILGGNPVYDAPADLGFAAALAKVKTSIHLAEYANETSHLATWHVPRAHFLEAWSDARTYDGTITIAQPLIQPLYGGITPAELLAMFLGDERTGLSLIQEALSGTPAKDGKPAKPGLGLTFDRKEIEAGYIDKTAYAVAPALTPSGLSNVNLTPSQLGTLRAANGELEVVFAPSNHTYDGRFANNAWLQETPDFLTKVTWDNHALVSPATATDLGLANDTLIKLKVNGIEMELPCYTMPGQAKFSIGVVLGGGRTRAGVVGGNGSKQVGFDTYKIRTTAGLDIATGCTVTATGKPYSLANVQEHWDIRKGLDKNVGQKGKGGIDQRVPELVRTASLDTYNTEYNAREFVEFWPEPARGVSLFQEKAYPGKPQPTGEPVDHAKHAWAMAIDLGNCTGCNSCMVACQAENNVPVVGKDQVFKNREMHWIRIDRYFRGPVDDPEVAHQPLTCQHCENAPCEQVCPVGATTHSSEGLNDMAYNRCIGTRYCLNNCPYRVRRFNFFDYHREFNDARGARNKVRKLLFNPEVTVRARGVMEKCTFCVQRIQNGKISAKAAGRTLADGEIVTACQAACPTEAIVFGDLADKNSRVSQLHADRRAYGLLDEELYTKPRNQFLAKIRNPNPSKKLAGLAAAAPAHSGKHE